MMNDHDKELLSALMDGELQGQELDAALQLIQTNEQAKDRWQHYQLTSDVLHGRNVALYNHDLTARISSAIANEPTHSVPNTKANVIAFPKQFWKQAAGFAVAASLGALAVIGVNNQPQNNLVPNAQIASVEVEPAAVSATQKGKLWTVGENEVEQRLNTYLVEHNEYSDSPSVFSYARVISYDAGQ